MLTAITIIQFVIVFALIFIGARTESTHVGRYVINHSFQKAGFITTFVSIGLGYLIILFI